MSFDLGSIVGGIAKAVLPMAIEAVCPESALIPGLNNMVANMAGDMLSQAIDGAMQQSGSPSFMINDALNLVKQAVQHQQQPCDGGWQDQIKNQFGDLAHNMISDFVNQFLQHLKDECGHGGKGHGGKGGAGGAGGSSGPVTLRDLAKALGQLEEQEAKKVKDKVDKANAALQQGDTAGTGQNGALTQADNNANAQNKASQFEAMEDVKAESQIQQTLSSMVSEVIKNFGGSLQATGRA
jgi:hypothetical protein